MVEVDTFGKEAYGRRRRFVCYKSRAFAKRDVEGPAGVPNRFPGTCRAIDPRFPPAITVIGSRSFNWTTRDRRVRALRCISVILPASRSLSTLDIGPCFCTEATRLARAALIDLDSIFPAADGPSIDRRGTLPEVPTSAWYVYKTGRSDSGSCFA